VIKYSLSDFGFHRNYASIIDNPVQLLTEHTHDYFELTLVRSGSCIHHINGTKQNLYTACLSFIRPSDYHYYQPLTPGFAIINVCIPRDTISSLFEYLGNGFEPARLLNAPTAPTIQITMADFEAVQNELKQLILYKKLLGQKADALFHITLMSIITRHFPMTLAYNHTNVPLWLQWLILEMFKKENYVEGLPAMYRLTNKTQEHICRSCRKYLKLSPSQLINDIRLRQSAHMLINTEDKIIDICHESGFDNLSNFYHLFKKTYGISPRQFRMLKDPARVQENTIASAIFPDTLPMGDPPPGIAG
jgi:AraC family transcriptional regulator, dual regulator of chb operon